MSDPRRDSFIKLRFNYLFKVMVLTGVGAETIGRLAPKQSLLLYTVAFLIAPAYIRAENLEIKR